MSEFVKRKPRSSTPFTKREELFTVPPPYRRKTSEQFQHFSSFNISALLAFTLMDNGQVNISAFEQVNFFQNFSPFNSCTFGKVNISAFKQLDYFNMHIMKERSPKHGSVQL